MLSTLLPTAPRSGRLQTPAILAPTGKSKGTARRFVQLLADWKLRRAEAKGLGLRRRGVALALGMLSPASLRQLPNGRAALLNLDAFWVALTDTRYATLVRVGRWDGQALLGQELCRWDHRWKPQWRPGLRGHWPAPGQDVWHPSTSLRFFDIANHLNGHLTGWVLEGGRAPLQDGAFPTYDAEFDAWILQGLADQFDDQELGVFWLPVTGRPWGGRPMICGGYPLEPRSS